MFTRSIFNFYLRKTRIPELSGSLFGRSLPLLVGKKIASVDEELRDKVHGTKWFSNGNVVISGELKSTSMNFTIHPLNLKFMGKIILQRLLKLTLICKDKKYLNLTCKKKSFSIVRTGSVKCFTIVVL